MKFPHRCAPKVYPDKDLLYSMGNYIQYFAIIYKEKYYLTLTSDHLVETDN